MMIAAPTSTMVEYVQTGKSVVLLMEYVDYLEESGRDIVAEYKAKGVAVTIVETVEEIKAYKAKANA